MDDLTSIARMPPWEHQVRAFDHAKDRRGSLLAVAMGGGKTFIALNLLFHWEVKRAIIVCPKSVISVWPRQVELHRPEFKVYTLTKGTVSDKTDLFHNVCNNVKAPFLIVVNYESIWRTPLGKAVYIRQDLDAVVLDECHRIKAAGSKVSWYFRSLGAYIPKKLGLSGTPLPNSPVDIYGQARFLDPSEFGGNNAKFKAKYTIAGGYQGRQIIGYRNEEEFRERYNRIVVTVTNDELDYSLPDAIHKTIEVTLPKKVRKAYQKLEEDFIADVKKGVIIASNALVRMLRLSQMANGHVLVEREDETTEVRELHQEKQNALQEFLEDLPIEEKVVVFCRFRHDLKQIHEACRKADREHFELSGSTNHLDEWHSSLIGGVLAVQIQAGAEGVDVTAARYCCSFSLDFSLGRYEQSLARIHRPGQERTCFYTHFVAKNTIDAKLYTALSTKRKVIDAILSDAAGEEKLDDLPF